MLEVVPGLLLGSMEDALAVFTRAPSVVKRWQVTHVLSLCNERPEWTAKSVPEEESGGSRSEEEVEDKNDSRGKCSPLSLHFVYTCISQYM